MLVVDASLVALALANDEDRGRAVRDRLRGKRVYAPALIDVEVLSVVRRGVHRGELTPQRGTAAVERLMRLPLVRVPHRALVSRCWELRDNLSSYDAAYVALAERMDVLLLTADGPLTRAPGIRCGTELMLLGGSLA